MDAPHVFQKSAAEHAQFYQRLAAQVKRDMAGEDTGVECFAARLWEQQQKLRKQQQHADGFHSIAGGDALQEAFGQPTNGSGSPDLPQTDGSSTESAFIQRSEQDVLLRSCTTGRANLSSRLPAYQALPDILFTLLEGEAPCWYDQAFSNDQRRPPWYEREDLRVLSVGNSELDELDARISEFRGLGKLEVSISSFRCALQRTNDLLGLFPAHHNGSYNTMP